MIYADHGTSSLAGGLGHGAHLLSSHHRNYDELAEKELRYIAVYRKTIELDYIHLYGVYFSTHTARDVDLVQFQSILQEEILHF